MRRRNAGASWPGEAARRADPGDTVSAMTVLRSRASLALSSRWLRLCVGIGLLALLLHWVDFGELLTIAAAARLDVMALLPLVLLVDRLMAAFRWYLLVHGKNAAVTFWGIVPAGVRVRLRRLLHTGQRRR